MNPGKRHIEFPHHLAEGSAERGPPTNQHVIMAGMQPTGAIGTRHADHFAQPPPHPVTLDGIADLSGYGKADAGCPILGTPPCLKHEGAARGPHTIRSGPKIVPAFQPFDDDGSCVPVTH
jgi:hypothetical protein